MTERLGGTIAIMGTGAMGSVLAGRLAAAGGAVVAIVRDPAHREAIARHGLLLDGPEGVRRVPLRVFLSAADAADAAGRAGLVILATKAAAAADAARAAGALMRRETAMLAIQNGLGSAGEVADVVGAQRLAIGVAVAFGASLPEPGRACHAGPGALHFGAYASSGKDAGTDPACLERIASALDASGIPLHRAADVRAMQWEKLICNAAFSGPCAASGLSVGEVLDNPELAQVCRAAGREAWEVARALGITLDVQDPEAHVMAFGARVRAARPSVLQDIDRGRPSEIGYINGAVVREAQRAGLTAPVNATLTALVRAREAQGRNPRGQAGMPDPGCSPQGHEHDRMRR
ncbi:MAG: 2-dehydropantoate 2-reductase [Rhodobacteraceae bacterium]|nr:2-dehydropantoate 2-reductase [Paracoccaceae bacterium]